MPEHSSYSDPAVRTAIQAVTNPNAPFSESGLPQHDTSGVAVGFREGVAAERARQAAYNDDPAVTGLPVTGRGSPDVRTCERPGDQEHDHTMCQDVVAEQTWQDGKDLPPCQIRPGRGDEPHYPQTETHTWGAFAGMAIELGGYSDVELVDPYSGSRFWCPVPTQVWDKGMIEAYKYALDQAVTANWPEHAGPIQVPPPA
jgi:hypothetical protein